MGTESLSMAEASRQGSPPGSINPENPQKSRPTARCNLSGILGPSVRYRTVLEAPMCYISNTARPLTTVWKERDPVDFRVRRAPRAP